MVVDLRSPVRPVSFLARSQSHSLHVSSAHILPSCLRSPSLPLSRCLFRHHSPHCVLFFPPHHETIYHFSLLRYLFRRLCYFRRSSNVFVPDLVLPGHPPAHPSQHPHLINLNPCFLSFGGDPSPDYVWTILKYTLPPNRCTQRAQTAVDARPDTSTWRSATRRAAWLASVWASATSARAQTTTRNRYVRQRRQGASPLAGQPRDRRTDAIHVVSFIRSYVRYSYMCTCMCSLWVGGLVGIVTRYKSQ